MLEIQFFKIAGTPRVEKVKNQTLRTLSTKMDLENSLKVTNLILSLIARGSSDNTMIEGLTVAAIITYTRCFNSTFSFPLNHDIFENSLPPGQLGVPNQITERNFHFLIMNYRNKHIAHSDDFLKSGDVGGANNHGAYTVATLLATRQTTEESAFYESLKRLIVKALTSSAERLKSLENKIIELLQTQEATITAEQSRITPIPLEVDPSAMWGLSEVEPKLTS